ncbi:hypothetical protein SAMN04488554_0371 [Ruania alba]|uniref:Uncharacterized protein n=1 Tax=Ruania alba TaxID=648782 RepID=A0A1H5CH14_9MICO|nr:hypothetical protein SAMN04488554_0371 [Ruania alba]
MALLTLVASGSAGPGRMAEVGADPIAVGVAMLWQVGAPAAVFVLLGHTRTIGAFGVLAQRARAAGGSWWEQVHGRPVDD